MEKVFFRNHVLTKGLTAAEIDRLSGLLVEHRFNAGDALFTEGTSTRGLYLLAEGQVRVSKNDPAGSERELVELVAPTVLGELELISQQPSFATATALTSGLGLVLEPDAFDRLVNEGDPVASKITRNTARVVIARLAESNTQLVALVALMNS